MSLTRLLASLPEPLFSTYSLEKVLGVGAYAVVYGIRDKQTSEKFALKVIEIEPMRVRHMLPQLEREVKFLEEFSDMPHIVEMLEVTRTKTHIFLRFELCQRSLEDLATNEGPMREEEAFLWLREACLGVQGLHASGAIHRDLKPSNLLVDAEGAVKICDFGWACWEEQELTGTCGTPEYSSPETRMKEGPAALTHSCKADIYALGACLQHLLLGRVPKGPADLPKGIPPATLELLGEMMDSDPDVRPSIEELLQRPQLVGDSVVAQLWSQWRSLFDAPLGATKTPKQVNLEADITGSCGLGRIY
jgi:serine/threonine protein kinase